jgi:hypothetical protein
MWVSIEELLEVLYMKLKLCCHGNGIIQFHALET